MCNKIKVLAFIFMSFFVPQIICSEKILISGYLSNNQGVVNIEFNQGIELNKERSILNEQDQKIYKYCMGMSNIPEITKIHNLCAQSFVDTTVINISVQNERLYLNRSITSFLLSVKELNKFYPSFEKSVTKDLLHKILNLALPDRINNSFVLKNLSLHGLEKKEQSQSYFLAKSESPWITDGDLYFQGWCTMEKI